MDEDTMKRLERDREYMNMARMEDSLTGHGLGGMTPANPAATGYDTRRQPSLAEQHEKSAIHYQEKADKARRASDFLRAHPEFNEFVELLRLHVFD